MGKTVNLTTIERVKAYLQISSTGADASIASLIPAESRLASDYMGRPGGPYVRFSNVLFNGTGSAQFMPPVTPILSVEALTIGGALQQPSSDGGIASSGFGFDEDAVWIVGSCFPYGKRTFSMSYTAGWASSETDSVPVEQVLKPTTDGLAVVDIGVAYTGNGVAHQSVDSNPGPGQYTFAPGVYGFSALDEGIQVTMSYGYVPPPIEQAVIEMVGIDLKARDNLGINSKSLGGETISYSPSGMNLSVKQQLQPYRIMLLGNG